MEIFGKNLIVVSKSALTKICEFVSISQERSTCQILLVCFVYKPNCLIKKLSKQFRFLKLKGHEKFWQKLNGGFEISSKQIGEYFFPAGEKSQNFKF